MQKVNLTPEQFYYYCRCLFLTLISLAGYFSTNAQGLNGRNILFSKNHWSLVATPLLVNKPDFIVDSGSEAPPPEVHNFGYNVGILHTFNINNKWSITTGLEGGSTPFKVIIDLDRSKYDSIYGTTSLQLKYSEFGIAHFKIPILLNRTFNASKSLYTRIFGGINLSYNFVSGDYSFSTYSVNRDSTITPIFWDNFTLNEADDLKLNYVVGGGVMFKLKNLDFLTADIIYNHSPQQIISNGKFEYLSDSPYETVGKIKFKGSYLGLRVGYTLTGARKTAKVISGEYRYNKENKPAIKEERKFNIRALSNEALYSVNHFEFFTGVNVFQKAKLIQKTGSEKINTFIVPGVDFGLNYHWNFNEKHSLVTGFKMSYTHDNYNLHMTTDPPVLNSEIELPTNKGLNANSYGFSFLFEKRLKLNQQSYLVAQAGINIERYIGMFISDFEYDSSHYFGDAGTSNYSIDIEQNPNDNFHINPYLTVGVEKILRNKNIFTAKLQFNYATGLDRKGIYELYRNSSKNSTGNYEWKASYMGVSFGYKFVPKKKILRRK